MGCLSDVIIKERPEGASCVDRGVVVLEEETVCAEALRA